MTLIASFTDSAKQAPGAIPRSARVLLGMLTKVRGATLTLRLPDGQTRQFGSGRWQVNIDIHHWRVFDEVMASGDIGFAEAFIRGDWDCHDLTDTLEFVIANRTHLEKAVYGSLPGRLFHRLRHLFNRNTRNGAKKNIHAHYDLGNAFYELWLDQTMTYSSALFGDGGASADSVPYSLEHRDRQQRSTPHVDLPLLEAAQQRKYQRILEQTHCRPGARLLEIGSGWGGFAQMAADQGMSVNGLTLSAEQLAFANQQIHDRGLAEQISMNLQDYRDEHGQYDGVVSIEMFEAVGESFWPGYFDSLKRCLKPGGHAVIQTITIADELFERYRVGTDFIQQYIFPGGMLPSPDVFRAQADRAGLEVCDQHDFGMDYARTLACWRERFTDAEEQVNGLGFDKRFKRTWLFYLAYCEAAFVCRNTSVSQFTLRKPI